MVAAVHLPWGSMAKVGAEIRSKVTSPTVGSRGHFRSRILNRVIVLFPFRESNLWRQICSLFLQLVFLQLVYVVRTLGTRSHNKKSPRSVVNKCRASRFAAPGSSTGQ